MTNADRILDILKRYPEGLDDDELSQLSGVTPRQTVNQIARSLEVQGTLIRRRDFVRGKIVNRLIKREAPLSPVEARGVKHQSPAHPAILSEDDVKKAMLDHLTQDGWTVHVKWGRAPGIDIEAVLGERVLCIEAKGEVSLRPQMVNYFLGALGELLQRMDAPGKEYGLALPTHSTYVGLVNRLPLWVKQRLNLQFFFVRRDGDNVVVDHQSF